ncbi:MAG: translation elongation factor Ts [Chloroflexota bacterium]|nr:translation elongation factor Ts [Chloroflexota bacterium]
MGQQITAQMVKDLREMTGAGPLDCKKALESSSGDVTKAAAFLREKGLAKAAKKLSAGRTMNEGLIESYLHFNKRVGVMVEINCETDFVANTDTFRQFCRDVALHIANLKPMVVRREQLPEAMLATMRAEFMVRAREDSTGKPDAVIEKIVNGRLETYIKEVVLMEQSYIKDDNKTIAQMLHDVVVELGESMEIRRFARFELGEVLDVDTAAAAPASANGNNA